MDTVVQHLYYTVWKDSKYQNYNQAALDFLNAAMLVSTCNSGFQKGNFHPKFCKKNLEESVKTQKWKYACY